MRKNLAALGALSMAALFGGSSPAYVDEANDRPLGNARPKKWHQSRPQTKSARYHKRKAKHKRRLKMKLR